MNTTTSYNKILQTIDSFASQHLQIKKYSFDFDEQMPNLATLDEKYPFLFVSPNSSTFNENTNEFTLNIYCFDIIQKDRSNINTIVSDTNQILNDLYRWFFDGSIQGIDLLGATNATPINNALLDYCAGWQMQLTLTVDPYSFCDIPLT